ncbi:MAG: hypothetical protein M3Q48_12255, partial [Actinomycetota bacterium]|nr:hypothetical protein [Actinomycetota bacterium]
MRWPFRRDRHRAATAAAEVAVAHDEPPRPEVAAWVLLPPLRPTLSTSPPVVAPVARFVERLGGTQSLVPPLAPPSATSPRTAPTARRGRVDG